MAARVVVVWAGGVVPAQGCSDEGHRLIYSVMTADEAVTPFALGDLGDGDNYVHLCLCSESRAVEVVARAGVLEDPRGDLNPETRVEVVR